MDSARSRVSFEEEGHLQDKLGSLPEDDGFKDGYFGMEAGSDDDDDEADTTASPYSRRRASLSIRIPPSRATADIAFTALQYLPMPVLVLSSEKTVVMANEALGRLLGIEPGYEQDEDDSNMGPLERLTSREGKSFTDILYGTTLAQLGFDLLQNGSAVFVAWEEFLDTIFDDASKAQCSTTQLNTFHSRSRDIDTTPTGNSHKRSVSATSSSRLSQASGTKTEVHDAAVDVVFSTHRDSKTGIPLAHRNEMADHVQAQMIVSVWATEDEQYFTLTFTAARSDTGLASTPSSEGTKATSRTVSRTTTSYSAGARSGLSSSSSSSSRSELKKSGRITSPPTTTFASPTTIPVMDFPPRGPPSKASQTAAPSMFSKSNKLKEALLNSMNMPAYAMWKDESFGIPNKAAIKLLYPWIEDGQHDSSEQARDFLSRYTLYREDFSEEIPMDEFPIYRLMRLRERFENYRVGMYSVKDGSQMVFDTSGEPLRDDKGEFLGGVVLFHDVTDYARTISAERTKNERQFENICNMVPQMIWRTTPDGSHDYFSDRWYTYTGLTPEDSMGEGWVNAFHKDDLVATEARWRHSLATGDEYLTEYRAKSAAGEWRWMLGRAVPMRDENGKIVKWFGTCTDIHEQVMAREEAKQTKAQLEQVIEHAQITLWAVDKNYRLTLAEGKPMSPDKPGNKLQTEPYHGGNKFVGKTIWDIFEAQGRKSEQPSFERPIRDVISGRVADSTIETQITTTKRWFRTRLYPLLRQSRNGGIEGDNYIDGVVGVSMDVTELKLAAEEVAERDRENSRLMAQSVAAKEASKMKSQFLANMSHEIRTPIAGVIGMSELLLDDDSGELTKEQRECAENIQRSANGLLTVINDILDFSKVESGRLDIEEVQFDLSVVIRDVNKMLSFAAERKGLKYIDEIEQLKCWKVMGDPGRLRQVITNLLTNSIKFTSEGSVTLRLKVTKETDEMVEVHFTVEDTGIGIEEEVRRKLFKPFSQADSSTARRFGGTGLGLTISKNLVELMRGGISLESKLGVGTKATFWIPFHKAPYQSTDTPLVDCGPIPDRLQSELSVSRPGSDNSAPTTPIIPNKPTHKRDHSASGIPGFSPWPDGQPLDVDLSEEERKAVNVLVVEDNPINQQIALKTIKKLGFPVRAVWNGKEALDYLQTSSKDQPRPDIILMDVQMPIMDGYKATYTIRNARPFAGDPDIQGTPIVAMTASAIQGDREKCQTAGMDDYLAKPVKKPNLERMLVKWAIEGKRKRAELRNNPSLLRNASRPSNPRNGSSFASDNSSALNQQDHLSSELDRLEFVHRSSVQTSSESVSDRALRQQAAEEQAIALRDHELIEAGEDPKTRLGRGVSEAQQESPTSALTTENVGKLDMVDQRMAKLRKEHTGGGGFLHHDGDGSSVVATKADTASTTMPQGGMASRTNSGFDGVNGLGNRRSVGS
ncbi:hypothetical protein PRZ48_009313 [Zasmidium cellare]|uniref:histidine kinase n=1 Tax=Zasmidium cellare TaxID=395010 RepID=A0ABR0ECL0_ZASCE|nr:hypothetical protein PRZ48_009313 [Zasmidium cellare]